MRTTRSRAGAALLLLGLCGFLAGVASAATDLPDPRKIPIPPLGEIQVPTPERLVLANNMVVYLLEDHDFPVIDARALIRVGDIYDPPAKIGLAEIAGEVMRTGGSTSVDGDSLDHLLESMGASIEIGIGSTEGTATVSALKQDAAAAMRILADLLRNPAFPEEKIELEKTRMRTEIASRNDEMFDILSRELVKLIWGQLHPYARHPEYATIDAVNRVDLVNFHWRFFHPDRTILAVYGDFDSQEMKRLLKETFESWPVSTSPLPPDPQIPEGSTTGLYLAHKGDATNSAVVMGQIGMRRDDPDYPAIALLNEVLGGGFSSRLFNEIRTKRGLAYAAGSSPGAGYHHPGGMIFYAITQADSTAATAVYIRREVDKVLEEPVTEEEVERAREAILNSLVFDLSSKSAVLFRLAQYEFYGYPPDFLQTFQEKIRHLTPGEMLDAARRKIHPADLAVLVVGNREPILPSLGALGEVREIDITIPEPAGAEIPEGSEADFERGQEVLARAAQAMGGAALQDVQDITWVEEGTFEAGGMEMNATIKTTHKYPDCVYWEQTLPMAQFRQAVCGNEGWRVAPGAGVLEMKPEEMGQANSYRARDMLAILRDPTAVRAQALEDAQVNGRPMTVVAVRDERVSGFKIYFDQESGLIARMEFIERSPFTGSPGTVREDLSDYGLVGRVRWPHARKRTIDGQPLAEFVTSSVQVNTGVDDSLFARPGE